MITLKDLKPTTYKLELKIPNHEDIKGIFLEIVGVDSREYSLTAGKLYKKRGKKKDSEIEIEDAFDEAATLTASLIKGWSPTEFFGMEYSEENALLLIKDFDNKWIKEQIEEAAGERSNFFIKSHKKGANT